MLFLLGSALRAQTLTLTAYFYDTVITGLNTPTVMVNIGPDEFLICEKNTGRVKHYKNYVFQGNAIDLAVSNNSERGLLGICLDPNFTTNGGVYLYYSKAAVDGGSWEDNRVERFVWNGSTLTFDKTIIVFPLDTTQNNGPNHDGGIIKFGPDGKLYVMTGDLNRGRFTNPRIEQNTSTTAVAGVGAIYRLNPDGTIPSDNPFVSQSDPKLQAIFAYGFRNGYGMTFDPLTGRLWVTENGPNVYDEVNWFASGANSGWLKIMGPDSRNATYSENGNTNYDAGQLTYLPGAFYQDPVFSWLQPIGVTSIEFLVSHKFWSPEKNNVFIADINNGNIYLFTMNASRDGFVLSGGLADKVADNLSERNESRVGSGWGGVTDFVIAEDGYLYVVSLGFGNVYRIRPYNDKVLAKSFSIIEGSLKFGGLPQIKDSDNVYMNISGRAERGNVIAGQIELESKAPPPTSKTLKELHFVLESHVTGTMGEKIELWNYLTQNWEVVSSGTVGGSDKVTDVVISSNIERFIQSSDRAIRARLTWTRIATATAPPSEIFIDEATWRFVYQ